MFKSEGETVSLRCEVKLLENISGTSFSLGRFRESLELKQFLVCITCESVVKMTQERRQFEVI